MKRVWWCLICWAYVPVFLVACSSSVPTSKATTSDSNCVETAAEYARKCRQYTCDGDAKSLEACACFAECEREAREMVGRCR